MKRSALVTNLVVLLTYSNGSLHEVSRVKMADYPPEEQMVFNVFGGKFRSSAARDIYVYEGGWWRAMPSSLLFAEGAAATPAPRGRGRIVAKPAAPAPGVQPFNLKVSQVGCIATEEIWQLQREGAFAEAKTADGRLIQAYFDPQGAINYRITGADSFVMWGKLIPTWANRYQDGGAHSEMGSGTAYKTCMPGTIHTDAVIQ